MLNYSSELLQSMAFRHPCFQANQPAAVKNMKYEDSAQCKERDAVHFRVKVARLLSDVQDSVSIDQTVLSRIHRLFVRGKIMHRSEHATGQGGFSEVFKGRFRMDGHAERDVAMKRLRFHVADRDFKQVRLSFQWELSVC